MEDGNTLQPHMRMPFVQRYRRYAIVREVPGSRPPFACVWIASSCVMRLPAVSELGCRSGSGMALAKGLLLLLNESQAGLAAAQGNGTADWGRGGGNGTDHERRHFYNFYAMLLTLLIFTIVFGNVLVCMAVSREKALQTTTNYLIVSLAVADLLVATLVMPWVVYLETLVKEAVVHPSEPDRVCFLAEPERTRPKNTLLGLQSVSPAPSRPLPSGAGLPSPVEVPAVPPELNGHPRLKRAFEVPRATGDENEKPTLKSTVKGRLSQQKEKKATQMLAIVLGVFIICWLPFFITHILRVHCLQCYISPELYSTATWLGYVNSAVNPIIYTTFNVEFRKAFIKILHC
ncbi:UNVERIFIED_CONTAM: hypothetical protein FKN15_059401 [Acipenser sinensis]